MIRRQQISKRKRKRKMRKRKRKRKKKEKKKKKRLNLQKELQLHLLRLPHQLHLLHLLQPRNDDTIGDEVKLRCQNWTYFQLRTHKDEYDIF